MTESSKYGMFRNRLEKVFKHRSKLARKLGVSCYRLYDRDLPEFPLIVELYGENLYVSEYRSKHNLEVEAYADWLEMSLEVLSEVTGIPDEQVYCKRRERKMGRQGQYQKVGEKKEEVVVQEGGLSFIVNLSDYLDTGLFLDHRITRDMVRTEAKGKSVLNLFCYTGSFTVYAAAGGATSSLSVDLSNTYIDWAKRNIRLNGFEDAAHKFLKADVLQVLPTLPDRQFDIVVLDPPSFSNSKMMKDFLDIQQDHGALIGLCLAKMKKGGHLYFSTNLRTFRLDESGFESAGIKDITKATTPFDFDGKLQRFCYKITC